LSALDLMGQIQFSVGQHFLIYRPACLRFEKYIGTRMTRIYSADLREF